MAIYEFIKSYSLLIKNQEKHPDFMLNKKGLGLLHALLGSIPKNYLWILNSFGINTIGRYGGCKYCSIEDNIIDL